MGRGGQSGAIPQAAEPLRPRQQDGDDGARCRVEHGVSDGEGGEDRRGGAIGLPLGLLAWGAAPRASEARPLGPRTGWAAPDLEPDGVSARCAVGAGRGVNVRWPSVGPACPRTLKLRGLVPLLCVGNAALDGRVGRAADVGAQLRVIVREGSRQLGQACWSQGGPSARVMARRWEGGGRT